MSKTHLKELLGDSKRNAALRTESSEGKFIFDATHTKIDQAGLEHLKKVAEETQLFSKIESMMKGEKINNTEGRNVLHTALRRPKEDILMVGDKDVVKDVHVVLDQIKAFSEKARNGEVVG